MAPSRTQTPARLGALTLAFGAGLAAGVGLAALLFPSAVPEPTGAAEAHAGAAERRPETGRPLDAPRLDAPPARESVPGEETPRRPDLPLPAGSGTLEGQVLTDRGDPVPEVRVSLRALPEPALPEPGAVARQPAPLAPTAEEAGHAVTDAAGRFRFEGLPRGRWRVSARRDGWLIAAASPASGIVRTGGRIAFVAARLVSVPIEVVFPDGTQPRYAVLRTERVRGRTVRTRSLGWSPGVPSVKLEEGRTALRAEVAGRAAARAGVRGEWVSDEVALAIDADAPPSTVRLVLHRRLGIRGRVEFGPTVSPAAVDVVQVLCFALRPDRELDARFFEGREGPTAWASPSDGYAFEFLDLLPGRYALGVRAGGSGPALAWRAVDLERGVEEIVLRVDDEELARRCLRVRLVGPSDEPVVGARFSLAGEESLSSWSRSAAALPAATPGRYFVVVPRDALERIGSRGFRLTLRVAARGIPAKEVPVESLDREVVVRFGANARLEVTVEGFDRPDVPRPLRVEIAGPSLSLSREPDPSGRVVFEPIEPGRFLLRLLGGSPEARRLLSQPIDVAAGTTRRTLAVPPLHTLEVVLPEAADGEQVALLAGWGGELRATVRQGRARFEGLPAGPYTIVWTGLGTFDVHPVTLPVAGPVVFAPSQLDALLVRIEDPLAPLARAGVADGDLIVSVDGEALSGKGRMETALVRALAREEVRVTLWRGGRLVEIRVAPGSALRARGVVLLPTSAGRQ